TDGAYLDSIPVFHHRDHRETATLRKMRVLDQGPGLEQNLSMVQADGFGLVGDSAIGRLGQRGEQPVGFAALDVSAGVHRSLCAWVCTQQTAEVLAVASRRVLNGGLAGHP